MKPIVKTLSLSAFVSVAALCAGQVWARGGPGAMFEKFDDNGDGKVTRGEMHAQVKKHLDEVDGNEDRAVTREEAKRFIQAKRRAHKGPEKWVEAHFRAHDKNENGTLERSEVRMPDELFERIDKNGDGALTKQEALEAAKERHQQMKQRRGKGDRGYERGPNGKSHFDRIDTNGDGKITEGEAKGAADRIFSRIDANSDNVITRDEVPSKTRRPGPDRRGNESTKKPK